MELSDYIIIPRKLPEGINDAIFDAAEIDKGEYPDGPYLSNPEDCYQAVVDFEYQQHNLVLIDADDLASLKASASSKLLTSNDLAEALDCFWNSAIGAERDEKSAVTSIAMGLAAVASRLRE